MTDLGTLLPDPPSDGITALRFANQGNNLLSASWDGTIKIYDAAQGILHTTLTQNAAILDATWKDNSTVISGSLDRQVSSIDITTAQPTTIGSHDAAVRCVEYIPSSGLIATAGWDKMLKIWDPRSQSPLIKQINLQGKAFSMSKTDTKLVIATSGRYIDVFNISDILKSTFNTPISPEIHRESLLKYQIRCLRCFPGNQQQGFAVSSIEGRVAIEYFNTDDPVIQAKQYAFKCHRKTLDGIDTIYPVNAIAFNSRYETFATGGCDGVVNIWDGIHKKRLHQISGYPTSISCLAFSDDSQLLAVASSYTFENGEQEQTPKDGVYVRKVNDVEIKPRQKLGQN